MRRARRARRGVTIRIVGPLVVIGLIVILAARNDVMRFFL